MKFSPIATGQHHLSKFFLRFGKKVGITILIFVFVLILIRLSLPFFVLRFVNRQLNQIPGYTSHVEDIHIHLWRGAYDIVNLRMLKKGGDPDAPFVEIPILKLSMEWRAIFYGRFVGKILIQQPTLRFIYAEKKDNSQFSFSKEWKEQGEKLFPFQLNRFEIENGQILYQDRHASPPIVLSIKQFHLLALNIQNINRDNGSALPAQISSQGIVFNSGKFNLDAKANLNHDPEDFTLQFKLTGVDITQLNVYFKHYGGFDFTRGKFELFSEIRAQNGSFEGYLKPLLENFAIMDSKEKFDDPFDAFWQSIVAGVMGLFKNQPTDRFATVIPLSGSLQNPKTGLLATIGNILRNAFIEAFEPKLDHTIAK
ncbi:MAG: DUF748 domain-containing protein [Verrucomicrobiota bacterium]